MSNHKLGESLRSSLLVALIIGSALVSAANEQPIRPWRRGLSTRAQPQPQSQPQPQPQPQSASVPSTIGTGSAVEVAPPANQPLLKLSPGSAPSPSSAGSNRTTRTADVFQAGEGYNLIVTNTCERESMKVNIKFNRPFNGVIHTRIPPINGVTQNQRQKQICTVEGNNGTDYTLEVSHVLNTQDPAYCGVIKTKKESPDDKDVLSLAIAVHFHPIIEISDDKHFVLNCTNRCRKPDCSSPSANLVARPNEFDDAPSPNSGSGAGGGLEREGSPGDVDSAPNGGANSANNDTRRGNNEDECTIWKFPWAITLLWCLGILLLAMIISHCIMCSSMVCKCVRTEVEEVEPSVYEGSTDHEDDATYNKRHPYRIDYDNKDIYKTSNNYAPYNLEEAREKSRRKQHRKLGRTDDC